MLKTGPNRNYFDLAGTAGSIFKKLRGLRAKIWTKLQFLLTCDGLRVDYQKAGGLLCKTYRRTGIYAYGPLDRDLVALVRWDLDLISSVDFGSNDPGRT